MKEQLTITQYAYLLGVTRDAIHKRIKRGDKLPGVSNHKAIGKTIILTVDKAKAIEREA